MSRISANAALLYSPDALKPKKPSEKALEKDDVIGDKKLDITTEKKTVSKPKVEISKEARELKEKLDNVAKAQKIHQKKFGDLESPGVFFVSGFDWFGAGSIKGNYDGIRDMSDATPGAKHYAWDEKEKIISDIMKRKPDQPIVLVGHSFGGDTIVEIANELNTIEKGFRKIDLMITLDSVGMNNDRIPQNVAKNLNYLATGPYHFLNDEPNIAVDYTKTSVENMLRNEVHSDLDDTIDVQVRIMNEVDKILQA